MKVATIGFTLLIPIAASVSGASAWGDVIVNLSPDSALVNTTDSAGKTVHSTTPAADNSILPSKPIQSDESWVKGITLNVTFTPAPPDLTGTVLLIEIGGSSNGTGLYLIDGVPTLVSKQSSTPAAFPSDLNDTDLAEGTMAVQAPGGALIAGKIYSVAAILSFAGDVRNSSTLHAADATVAVDEGGAAKNILFKNFNLNDMTSEGINWSGNQTVSVRTRSTAPGLDGQTASGYVGGLSQDAFVSGVFYAGNTDGTGGCKNLAGAISQALLWNDTGKLPESARQPTTAPSAAFCAPPSRARLSRDMAAQQPSTRPQ